MDKEHMKYLLAVIVASLALLSLVLLGIALEKQSQLQQSSPYLKSETPSIGSSDNDRLPSLLVPLAAAANTRSEIALLDNDQDHDGNYDSITDPLAVIGLVLVVLSMRFVLRPLVSGNLLLSFCEPPKLSSIWSLVLERPG